MVVDLYVKVTGGGTTLGELTKEVEWPPEWRLPVAGEQVILRTPGARPPVHLETKRTDFFLDSQGVCITFRPVDSHDEQKLKSSGWTEA
jgi:hypothetical protein